MSRHEAIRSALNALEPSRAADAPAPNQLREPLSDGERALFDRALELRNGYDDLQSKLLRSAVFAEASLGTAAFIHELRQCLAPIIGLAELMKESPTSPFAGEWVSEISAQALRLADLLDRHASLLKTHSTEEEPCDLSSLATEGSRYFVRLPPGVKLRVEVPHGLPHVRARKRQLLHALINVLANARDAHKGKPGEIFVSARVHESFAELVIADQGAGIDPAIRSRLFEPLFTTKREDGTGLGLYLSRELLRPHGELLLLDPAEVPDGYRTAFAIRLPLVEVGVTAKSSGAAAALPVAAPTETSRELDVWTSARREAFERASPLVAEQKNNPVLLVEDEPAVRRMTRAVLESVASIKIYEAADAALALGLLEKVRVDFIVCDKNLPDQDGLEVIRKARVRYPSIDAMIVTGYPSADSVSEAIRMGATDYLLKPIRELKTLRESVSGALARQRLGRLVEQHDPVWRELTARLRKAAPDAERAQLLDRVSSTLSSRMSGPPTVAVVGRVHLPALLDSGFPVVLCGSAADLSSRREDIDLVVFGAEEAPESVRELAQAARSRAMPAQLVALGRFVNADSAIAAIQGRTQALLETDIKADLVASALTAAAERRREHVRWDALGRLLTEMGITP